MVWVACQQASVGAEPAEASQPSEEAPAFAVDSSLREIVSMFNNQGAPGAAPPPRGADLTGKKRWCKEAEVTAVLDGGLVRVCYCGDSDRAAVTRVGRRELV